MDQAPIRDAIILAEPGDPLRPVVRVPLLVRTILALQRSGIERCTLVGALSPPADGRIRCRLTTAPTLTPRNVTGAPTERPLIEPSKTTAARVVGLQMRRLPKSTMAPSASTMPPSTKPPIAVCLSAI